MLKTGAHACALYVCGESVAGGWGGPPRRAGGPAGQPRNSFEGAAPSERACVVDTQWWADSEMGAFDCRRGCVGGVVRKWGAGCGLEG